MIVRFYDYEYGKRNPRDGTSIGDSEVESLMDELESSLSTRAPFIFALKGEDDHELGIGLSPEVGCAMYNEHSCGPYFMAFVYGEFGVKTYKYREFLCGGTPTPIDEKYCIPLHIIRDIVTYFVRTGRNSDKVEWEK